MDLSTSEENCNYLNGLHNYYPFESNSDSDYGNIDYPFDSDSDFENEYFDLDHPFDSKSYFEQDENELLWDKPSKNMIPPHVQYSNRIQTKQYSYIPRRAWYKHRHSNGKFKTAGHISWFTTKQIEPQNRRLEAKNKFYLQVDFNMI